MQYYYTKTKIEAVSILHIHTLPFFSKAKLHSNGSRLPFTRFFAQFKKVTRSYPPTPPRLALGFGGLHEFGGLRRIVGVGGRPDGGCGRRASWGETAEAPLAK